MKRDFLRTFYKPTQDMTLRLIEVQRRDDRRSREEHTVPEPIIELAREDIALRIWGFMAGLARVLTVPDERHEASLHCDDTTLRNLAVDLQRDLAVPEYEDDEDNAELGNSILQDFLRWLQVDQLGKYKASWGKMAYDGEVISFSDVHNPAFLTGDYEKGRSVLGDDDSSSPANSGSGAPSTPSAASEGEEPLIAGRLLTR